MSGNIKGIGPSSVLIEKDHPKSINYQTLKFETAKETTKVKYDPISSFTSAPVVPSNCNCKSGKSGDSYNFCYVDPQNSSSIGKKFDCAHLEVLEKLKLVNNPGPFSNLSQFSKDVVFVSAASDNHVNQATQSIASFYKYNPNGKYIFYSLNLGPYHEKTLKKKFPTLEVRVFNSTGYPEYTNNWMEYRFKVLILAEVMKEYSNIWWLDANIRVEKENITDVFSQELEEIKNNKNAGKVSSIYSFVYTGHGNFPVMFPELLTYFPTNSMDLLKSEKYGAQLGANAFFVAKTEKSIELFKWWVLCALDKICMNPPGAQVHCAFEDDRYAKPANCFRFDQSVLNILLFNEFQDYKKYLSKHGEIFSRTS